MQARSRIVDGCYKPGHNANIRAAAMHEAFCEHPEMKEVILKHEMSRKFLEQRVLEYRDKLLDGFSARFSKEWLCFDSREDPGLRSFLEACERLVDEERSPRQKVLAASMAVTVASGKQDGHFQWCERAKDAGLKSPTEPFHIGSMLCCRRLGIPGAGQCRHRSLLLKYVLDMLDVVPCAVMDGVVLNKDIADTDSHQSAPQRHMWTVVWLEGQSWLLDMSAAPFLLMPGDFLNIHFQGYHRVNGRAGLSIAPPSMAMSHGDSDTDTDDIETDETEVDD